jgi:GNAT superfamily N-acetyltransferase
MMRVAQVFVTVESPSGDEALYLIENLSMELLERYGDSSDAFCPTDVKGPGGAFVIAWLDKRPLGFGAFGPLHPGVGELKRVFVEKDARQRGVASGILDKLEVVARQMQYDALRVAPRLAQPEAIRLYRSAGYAPIPRYGRFVGNPFHLCLEKRLEL